MKKTPFYQIHLDSGARMVEFAGFLMPVYYKGINIEHINVRKNVGIFDVSHMGEIWARGPHAFDLVQYLTTNDVAKLKPGKAQYTCFPNGKGGIVDDLIIYQYSQEEYLMVVNAANIEKDWNWVKEHNKKFGAQIENASEKTAQLAVQGPKATELLQNLTDINLAEIKFYHFTVGELAGVKNMIISATGYTGSGGFELYFPVEYAKQVLEAIMQVGENYNLMPAGLGARDTLRLEMGYCLYGNDIDETTSPIEAGLSWIVKFTDGNNFIDRERLEMQKKNGVNRKLIGFIMQEKGIPRQHYNILNDNKETIGEVTSGTMSPMLKQGIGMGYVKTEYAKPETEIFIDIRGKALKAKVVKPPFVKIN